MKDINQLKLFRRKLQDLTDEQRQVIANKYGVINLAGHILSPTNQVLLYWQSTGLEKPITQIAGFKQWKDSGHIVKKGEHGLMIFFPAGNKNSEGVIEDMKFFVTNVFDIQQTELIK